MADKKISQLNTATTVFDADDFTIVQDGETKQANASVVKTYVKDGLSKSDVGLSNVDNTSDATKNSATVTLTNKTLTSPTINGGSANNVAIGGTAPAAGNFTTLGATGNVTLGDANTDTLTINGTAASIPNSLNFDSNTLFIDAGANRVGLGTATPGSKLTVLTTTNDGISVSDGTVNTVLYNSGGTTGLIGTLTNHSLAFYTNNTSKMLLDTSGRLGVGVSPAAKLDVAGDIRGTSGSGNASLIAANTSAGSAAIELIDGATTPNRWWLLSGLGATTDGIFSIYDRRQSISRLVIDTSGNVGIGVTPNTGYSACLQLKSGITFPATQVTSSNANTLDDYEEGTWTPSVGGTATYTIQDGYYVKIGKVVYASARFLINVIGTGSTSTISGLPFVSANTFARGELTVGQCAGLATSLYSLTLEVVNNNSTIIFQGRTAAGNQTDISAAMGNGSDIRFSGFYFVG
jgi:hypothetical protein